MTRKRNKKINLSDEGKVYKLVEILGRKNPHIDTADKIKRLFVGQATAEEILQDVLQTLMFRFEIGDAVKDEALRFINTIRNENKTASLRIPEKKLKVIGIRKKFGYKIKKHLMTIASYYFKW